MGLQRDLDWKEEAKWKKKYEEDDIYEDIFYGFDQETEVSYMHSEEDRYVESDQFTGFIKDNEGPRYALWHFFQRKREAHILKNQLIRLIFVSCIEHQSSRQCMLQCRNLNANHLWN